MKHKFHMNFQSLNIGQMNLLTGQNKIGEKKEKKIIGKLYLRERLEVE